MGLSKMVTNLNEINHDQLFKQAVSIIFDELNKATFVPDWDKAFLRLLENDTLPLITMMHFKFADVVVEEVTEFRNHKFGTFPKNVLEQMKTFQVTRRKETIRSILEVDHGPSLRGFWLDLGLEFWSKMCQIDVKELKEVLPSNFLLEPDDPSKPDETVSKKAKTKKRLEKIYGPIRSLIEFIWGSHVQQVEPRRVISMDERFKVISYEKLLQPQSDLKEEEKAFGLNQRVKKMLLFFYKMAIKSVGGNWPRTYKPRGEEILNDMFIWVLELDKAHERIRMFKKNMIKREIIL